MKTSGICPKGYEPNARIENDCLKKCPSGKKRDPKTNRCKKTIEKKQKNKSTAKTTLIYNTTKHSEENHQPKTVSQRAVYIPVQIPKAKKCLKDLILKGQLGAGAFGSAYEACRNAGDCGYVVKIMLIDKRNEQLPGERIRYSLENFNSEASVCKWAGEHGVGPKVYDYWTCSSPMTMARLMANYQIVSYREIELRAIGFIVMEKLDITLRHYIKKHPSAKDKYKKDIENLKAKLAEGGYQHEDAHNNNIMLKLDKNGTPTQIYLIDFGMIKQI